MAWTAPMTAVANAVFTAAQFNTHVRDNLVETAPAKATTAGGYFVTTSANSIAERVTATATVATSQSTTVATYGNLTTAGPAVTVTTGTSAIVFLKAGILNTVSGTASFMGVDISGASTVAAADTDAICGTTTTTFRIGGAFLFTGLTAGSNTFTAKYRTGTATTTTATFVDRDILVLPL